MPRFHFVKVLKDSDAFPLRQENALENPPSTKSQADLPHRLDRHKPALIGDGEPAVASGRTFARADTCKQKPRDVEKNRRIRFGIVHEPD